jgi:hypothetical protein
MRLLAMVNAALSLSKGNHKILVAKKKEKKLGNPRGVFSFFLVLFSLFFLSVVLFLKNIIKHSSHHLSGTINFRWVLMDFITLY